MVGVGTAIPAQPPMIIHPRVRSLMTTISSAPVLSLMAIISHPLVLALMVLPDMPRRGINL